MAANGIGAALRAIREREGLTLTAVARRAGISDAMLSRIERGERASPQFTTIAKIAYVLGTSLDEIAHSAGIATAVHRRTPSTAALEIRRSESLDKIAKHLTKVQTLVQEIQAT
jgi:transcriptional regulator with XRE-family HTH domain